VATAEIARTGYVNVRILEDEYERLLKGVLTEPAAWGRIPAVNPRRVNVEFVSANPTGPLTVGNARGAFVGDLLCRVLEAGGQTVTREYYFNDSGTQIDHLGASVAAVKRGEPVPEDGYRGAYVETLAREVPDDVWAAAAADGADEAAVLGAWASTRVRGMIEASLSRLGVHFDVWKSEASLHDEGWVERAVERLRAADQVYEQDGAVWFRSTAFGDDKDRVIYRSDGRPTYFAADIGYVTEKFSRGFDHLIYIWGVDHHGTVARNKNAAQAMGYDPDNYQVLLIGWVRFVVDGVEVSMSKRAGTFVTLDDLLDAVGTDAARWFFASRAAHVEIDFDIELAKKQSAENPVYYVQYAHARIASIVRKAAEAGLAPAPGVEGLLAGEPEAALARVVSRLPEVVEDAVLAEETQGITAYATELATQFHAFYRDARVLDTDQPERSARRLALALATQTTLANALGLLGISAPDAM
jgi:arginyl-tRNA synthetase